MKRLTKIFRFGAVLLFWITLWQLAASAVGRELLLPAPAVVFSRLGGLAVTAEFWLTAAASMLRILAGVAAAIFAGVLLAALTAASPAVYALVYPLLAAIRSTPIASFIILALVWIGRETLPALISFLIVLPLIWGNLSQGIRETDPRLLELAAAYAMPPSRVILRIRIPSLMPYFVSGCRTSIGLAWKSGVAAEVLAMPSPSVGRRLYESKLYLDMPGLFAWTLVVIVMSLIIERLLMRVLNRRWGEGGSSWGS